MQKSQIFTIVLLALNFSLLSCTNRSATNTNPDDSSAVNSAVAVRDTMKRENNPDSLLIAGVSAGTIQIDEDAEKVYKVFGKPDSGDAAMQKAVAIWYKNHDPKSYSTAIYSARDTGDNPVARIKQIRITSPGLTTKEGLGVSSMLDTIKKTLEVKKIGPDNTSDRHYTIYDSITGIAFEVGANEKCIAVIIHKSGEMLKSTYLPLR